MSAPSALAKKAKLVDDVFYWGEIERRLVKHTRRRYRLDARYLSQRKAPVRWRGYDQIAVIHVDGSIVSGRSLDDPFFGVHLAGAGTIVRLLRLLETRTFRRVGDTHDRPTTAAPPQPSRDRQQHQCATSEKFTYSSNPRLRRGNLCGSAEQVAVGDSARSAAGLRVIAVMGAAW